MTISLAKHNNVTLVSNIFVDHFMKDANGEFVKVYLYILRCIGDNNVSSNLSDIADHLNLTEKDVVRALKYWDKNKVLSVSFDSESGEPSSITALPLDAGVTESKATEEVTETEESTPVSTLPEKTNYSPTNLKAMKEQEEIKQLIYVTEMYTGKHMSVNDINTIIYFREGLGFVTELIEYLVEYCVSNQHNSIRYMEKVAISWYEQQITTVEAARSVTTMYSKKIGPVAKAFGINDRKLTPVEIDFVKTWYDTYLFSKELIVEACNRAVLATGKPNFSYTDGILRKWMKAEVKTMEDVQKIDASHRGSVTVPVVASKPAKKNQFNNFGQREYDFDEIEKKLISNNDN